MRVLCVLTRKPISIKCLQTQVHMWPDFAVTKLLYSPNFSAHCLLWPLNFRPQNLISTSTNLSTSVTNIIGDIIEEKMLGILASKVGQTDLVFGTRSGFLKVNPCTLDYKSLCAAVTICSTLVTSKHTHTDTHTDSIWPAYMKSSASWAK